MDEARGSLLEPVVVVLEPEDVLELDPLVVVVELLKDALVTVAADEEPVDEEPEAVEPELVEPDAEAELATPPINWNWML